MLCPAAALALANLSLPSKHQFIGQFQAVCSACASLGVVCDPHMWDMPLGRRKAAMLTVEPHSCGCCCWCTFQADVLPGAGAALWLML